MRNRFFAFDFDGVLADSLSIALEEYRRIIASEFPTLPPPYEREDLVHIFPGPLRTSLRRFGLSQSQSQRFFDLHSAAMRERTNEVKSFDLVVEILAAVPATRYAIVTSAYSDAVRSFLARSGFEIPGVRIYGRESRLPKSEKFRVMAEQNGIALDAVIKIGDMVSDVLYARDARVSIWAVGWGYHPLPYLAAFGPDECIETPQQLRDKILGE